MKRVVALLFYTACTVQQGKVPVLDSVSVPESVTLDADGTYHVDATYAYHDDDDEVSRVQVQIASLGATAQYGTPGGKVSKSATVLLKIVGTAPKGATELTFWVLDVEGNMSDPKTAKVTLK